MLVTTSLWVTSSRRQDKDVGGFKKPEVKKPEVKFC